MPPVSLATAEAPLVLALDVGTSSVRAILYDCQARAVAGSETQLNYSLTTTVDGGAVTDAVTLFDLLVRCIDGVIVRAGERGTEITAVSLSCFWHSLVGLDREGHPATPLLTWADTRSGPEIVTLRQDLDEDTVHERTGCVLHSSYWPAKLRWLRNTFPDIVHQVAGWHSFAEFAALRLHGKTAVTFSMASGTGLLDVHRQVWDDAMLDAAGIEADQLATLTDRDTPLPALQPEFAGRWPALAEVVWYPAIGDGASANVGSGAIAADRIALTLGTSGAMRIVVQAPRVAVPPHAWAYRLDRDRYVLGGALSNGGNLMAWLWNLLGITDAEAVLEKATMLAPDSHGLTMLPFIAGERSPTWNDNATGVISGLKLATGPAEIARAAMESVAYRFAAMYDALCPLADRTHYIVANGAAILRSPIWLQIVADTLNHELTALPPDEEASARGAAINALEACGLLPNLNVPTPTTRVYYPDAGRHERYQAARERQKRLEATIYP